MNRKRGLPSYLALTIITLIAGIALGATYSLTKDTISEQVILEAERARQSVVSGDELVEFVPLEIPSESAVYECYEVMRDGEHVGYVAAITEKGYGGNIDIIAGVDLDGTLTGVSVGGSNFSETPGLGAKAKNADFLDRFVGKTAPLTVRKSNEPIADNSVDALTSATVTSKSVVNGVNKILEFVSDLQVKGGEAQ